jgi:hypothetical protein
MGIVHGLGIPFGAAFGGGAVAALVGATGVAAAPFVAGMGVVAYGATRLGWRLRSAWWERKLRRVVERMSSIVQDVAVDPGDSEEDE